MDKSCNDYTELVGGPLYDKKYLVPGFVMFAPINTGHLCWSRHIESGEVVDLEITLDLLRAIYANPVQREWNYTVHRKHPKDFEMVWDGNEIFGAFLG